ncbi:MAG: hypothetical protein WAX89_03535, partial [Alphaproteobacteria bacterium]
ITLLLMFKIGDVQGFISNIAKIDDKSNEAADKATDAAKGLVIGTAVAGATGLAGIAGATAKALKTGDRDMTWTKALGTGVNQGKEALMGSLKSLLPSQGGIDEVFNAYTEGKGEMEARAEASKMYKDNKLKKGGILGGVFRSDYGDLKKKAAEEEAAQKYGKVFGGAGGAKEGAAAAQMRSSYNQAAGSAEADVIKAKNITLDETIKGAMGSAVGEIAKAKESQATYDSQRAVLRKNDMMASINETLEKQGVKITDADYDEQLQKQMEIRIAALAADSKVTEAMGDDYGRNAMEMRDDLYEKNKTAEESRVWRESLDSDKAVIAAVRRDVQDMKEKYPTTPGGKAWDKMTAEEQHDKEKEFTEIARKNLENKAVDPTDSSKGTWREFVIDKNKDDIAKRTRALANDRALDAVIIGTESAAQYRRDEGKDNLNTRVAEALSEGAFFGAMKNAAVAITESSSNAGKISNKKGHADGSLSLGDFIEYGDWQTPGSNEWKDAETMRDYKRRGLNSGDRYRLDVSQAVAGYAGKSKRGRMMSGEREYDMALHQEEEKAENDANRFTDMILSKMIVGKDKEGNPVSLGEMLQSADSYDGAKSTIRSLAKAFRHSGYFTASFTDPRGDVAGRNITHDGAVDDHLAEMKKMFEDGGKNTPEALAMTKKMSAVYMNAALKVNKKMYDQFETVDGLGATHYTNYINVEHIKNGLTKMKDDGEIDQKTLDEANVNLDKYVTHLGAGNTVMDGSTVKAAYHRSGRSYSTEKLTTAISQIKAESGIDIDFVELKDYLKEQGPAVLDNERLSQNAVRTFLSDKGLTDAQMDKLSDYKSLNTASWMARNT